MLEILAANLMLLCILLVLRRTCFAQDINNWAGSGCFHYYPNCMVVYGVEVFECLVAYRVVHDKSIVYLSSIVLYVSSRVFIFASQLFAVIVCRMLRRW